MSFREFWRRGFTLVELLVVLALVASLSAGIGLVFSGREPGPRLRSCEAAMAGLFHSARSQAVLLHTRTRVIVLDESARPDRRLREAGVVYEDPRAPGHWRTASRPVSFPDGIYFWPELSEYDGSFHVLFPVRHARAEGSGPRWHYYEFDGRGRLSADQRRVFVVGAPAFDPASMELPRFDEQSPIGGFAVFPLGGLGFPESPEDLR